MREFGLVHVQLDDERDRRIAPQDVFEPRHASGEASIRLRGCAELAAGVEPVQLVSGRRRERAAPAGGAPQRRVVVHDDYGREEMHVELEPVGPEDRPWSNASSVF
jgi:hypothetical protein